MPLTKKQTTRLHAVRDILAHGVAYIEQPRVAFCLKGGMATTTLHMTRPLDGAVFFEVEKAIGSELCYVWTALESLTKFLEEYGA